MIQVKGEHNTATIMAMKTDPESHIEDHSIAQIKAICDLEFYSKSQIKIMPDVHPGMVGPIGLTMTINEKDKIIPNLVGVDIGCGMSMIPIGKIKKEYQKIDSVIKAKVPTSLKSRPTPLNEAYDFDVNELVCAKAIDPGSPYVALGTLGGGNHFIEVDKDDDNQYYLIVHSGSRSLGVQVTNHYINKGHKRLYDADILWPYNMTYLEQDLLVYYLHDIKIVQEYAEFNRRLIIKQICRGMKWDYDEDKIISCPHNYIDFNGPMILRKGAISATEGENVIIPINMKDGVILGTGKGNVDWNYSAPHGAGRIYARKEVANHHTLREFKDEMKGVYSSCMSNNTLDEAPFAYRRIDYIVRAIEPTVSITKILKPVYNYKGGA